MSRKFEAIAAVTMAILLSAVVMFAAKAQDPAPPAGEGAAATTSTAEAARDPNAIIAKVGDLTVTEREISLAEEAFSSELANVPMAQWRAILADAVINLKLMALGAHEAGLDQGEDFEHRVEFLKLQTLRNLYVQNSVVKAVTDAELQQAYQTLVAAQFKPEQQVHARHILVETKEAAEKIIAELKGGASFEELAKQSKDPSGENGGDLGFFGPGQMVPPFEAAAFALEPGQITEQPVQSEFGWHVIKVEEKRMSEPPPFDQVAADVRNYVLRQKFDEVLAALRGKYTIEILDPTAEMPAEPPSESGETPPAPEDPNAAPAPAAPAPSESPAEPVPTDPPAN
jgi:peptidyl-prolyl cis-trans isomerase C